MESAEFMCWAKARTKALPFLPIVVLGRPKSRKYLASGSFLLLEKSASLRVCIAFDWSLQRFIILRKCLLDERYQLLVLFLVNLDGSCIGIIPRICESHEDVADRLPT